MPDALPLAPEAAPGAETASDPVAAEGAPRARNKRGYFVPGIIALVVCAGLATLIDVAGLQSRTPSRLVPAQTEILLSQAVQARQGLVAPPVVRCPSTVPVRPGVDFACTVELGGRPRLIRVHEQSGGRLSFQLVAPTG